MDKIKAVIFDLDGVLCHTDNYHYLAWKKVSDDLGICFNKEINNRLRGVSRNESFNIILEKYNGEMSEEEKEKYTSIKNNYYKEYLKEMSKKDIPEDVLVLLNYLKEKKIPMAIGSSSKNANFIIDQLEIRNYFDVIVDGNDIENSKPNPEVFLKGAKGLNLLPIQCLVVEDADAGVEAGLNGGFKVAAIGEATKSNTASINLNNILDIKYYF